METELKLFHGTWRFNPLLSNTCTPAPKSWVQEISAGAEQVAIREEIVRADGAEVVLRARARLDGTDYPVEGSAAVDTIAFTRATPHTIFGIGKKDGEVSVIQTILADPEPRTLTLAYNYLFGERIVAQGVAVFDQRAPEATSSPEPAARERTWPIAAARVRSSPVLPGFSPRHLNLAYWARAIFG